MGLGIFLLRPSVRRDLGEKIRRGKKSARDGRREGRGIRNESVTVREGAAVQSGAAPVSVFDKFAVSPSHSLLPRFAGEGGVQLQIAALR